jgi:hypothetical protein
MPLNSLTLGNGMITKNLLLGTFIGFAGTFIGCYLYYPFYNLQFNGGVVI